MTFLKNIWSDLVEKRLWPVALGLLLALVAVPVTLGAPDAPVAAVPSAGTTGATGPGGAEALTGQVAFAPAFPVRLDRKEDVRDPFRQQAIRKIIAAGETSAEAARDEAAAAAKPAPTGGSAPASGGGGSGPASGGTPATTPTDATPAPAPPKPQPLYVVALRFHKTDAKRDIRRIGRLTPLPSAEAPFLVHLGVLEDAETAVFLLSTDVKATGDGTCRPEAAACETVELKKGDVEIFDVTAEDGSVSQYELELLSVRKAAEGVSVSTDAKAASTDADEAGEDELGSDAYTLDEGTGLLRREAAEEDADATEEDADPATEPVPTLTDDPVTVPGAGMAATEPALPSFLRRSAVWAAPAELPSVLTPRSVPAPQP